MLGRRAFLTGLLLSLGAGSALAQNGAPAAPRPVPPRPIAQSASAGSGAVASDIARAARTRLGGAAARACSRTR